MTEDTKQSIHVRFTEFRTAFEYRIDEQGNERLLIGGKWRPNSQDKEEKQGSPFVRLK